MRTQNQFHDASAWSETGFVSLFDGKTLAGWTLVRGLGRGYVVEALAGPVWPAAVAAPKGPQVPVGWWPLLPKAADRAILVVIS